MKPISPERAALACAPVGCIAFIALYILAMSKDSEYELFDNYLSDLGVGPGAWAFNAGAIIAGCLLATFAIGGFRWYFGDRALMKAGCALLALSSVFLIGVGVFTEDAGDVHLFVSYAFFVCAFLSLAVLAGGRLDTVRNATDPFFLVSAVAFASGIIAVGVTGPDPFAETVAVFALLLWGLIAPLTKAFRHGKESAK
ncbi:MAG: DUF998 domain-containing protein [Methanobacteriota archaeon]|nr:MAG: DUF998 domain-containing protein [Euryarchaeota archaeon]